MFCFFTQQYTGQEKCRIMNKAPLLRGIITFISYCGGEIDFCPAKLRVT